MDDLAACREAFNHAGRVAAAIFSVFFTLFTQWSFAWVEAKPVIWMLVWFAGAYGTTRLAAWAAVRIACAPDGALPPTGSDDT